MPASYLIALAIKHLGLEDVTLDLSSLNTEVPDDEGTAKAQQGQQGKKGQQLRVTTGAQDDIQLATAGDTERSMGLVESDKSDQSSKSGQSEDSVESVVPISVESMESVWGAQINTTVQEWNNLFPLISAQSSRSRRDHMESMGSVGSLETTQVADRDPTVQQWNTLLPLISAQNRNSGSDSRRGRVMHEFLAEEVEGWKDDEAGDKSQTPRQINQQSMDNDTVIQEWLGLIPLMESQERGRKRTVF
ncbi:hypothetical protein FPQ18DRAFT_418685 [Pyronema domesticum]|nr:hypothetical protein FPQ18DRAFT_418685 [Pyronema domesticum]